MFASVPMSQMIMKPASRRVVEIDVLDRFLGNVKYCEMAERSKDRGRLGEADGSGQ